MTRSFGSIVAACALVGAGLALGESTPPKRGDATAKAEWLQAKASPAENPLAAQLDPKARELVLVAKVGKAAKDHKGGQGADPTAKGSQGQASNGPSGTAGSMGGALDPTARQIRLISKVAQANQAKHGEGTDPTKNGPSTSTRAASGHQNGLAAQLDPGARALKVAAQARATAMQKNNGGRPAEEPRGGRGSSRSASRADRAERPTAAVGIRGMTPMERATGRCHGRGECF